jgi:hypothetical protein
MPMQSSQPVQGRAHRLRWNLLRVGLVAWFLLGIVGYITALQNYVDHHVYTVQGNKAITITTARNQAFILVIPINDGIETYWASPSGLLLRFDGENTPLMVVPPKPQDWGDILVTTMSENHTSYKISGTVTIPDSIGGPEERQLMGRLSGSIVYAQYQGDFTDQNIDVNVPITIQLVSQSSYFWSSGVIGYEIFAWLDILFGALVLVLAAISLVKAVKMRRQLLRTTPFLRPAPLNVFLIIPSILSIALISASLIESLLTYRIFEVAPGNTLSTSQVISALIAIAVAVKVAAWLLVWRPKKPPMNSARLAP